MQKLIQKFINNPTKENAAALVKYLNKHPMAQCMASAEDSIAIMNARQLV